MLRIYLNIIFLLLLGFVNVNGQKETQLKQKDRNLVEIKDSSSQMLDTIPVPNDSLPLNFGNRSTKNVKFSTSSPETEIVYGAKDKKWFDLQNNLVHLYGEAFVEYGTLKLKAGYIVFDFKNNIATAEGVLDSVGNDVQKPTFKDGDNEFSYKKLRYNFKTKKGFVYTTYTKEGDLFVQGVETKFISKESDSTLLYDQIFNKNAIITSCELDHPHFGIRAQKLKVVPSQLAVLGPARLEIADIPTPLILPFGFFPLVQGKSSGLIFPDNYEYSDQWGFGLQNIGYYFGINDYIDMKVTGDIYLRGSWGLGVETNYTKRYKYRGGLTLAYSSRLNEVVNQLEKAKATSFAIRWNHNQDAKAHPYFTIGGSVNMEFGGYTDLNNPSFNSRANNNTQRSNLSLSHSLPGTPFSASASFNHSQNLSTGTVTMTFPNLQLRMNQIYPFKRKKIQGGQKWYENITLNYSSEAKNYVQANDSTFFSRATLDKLQYGVKHQASSGTSVKVLKYFNFNPSVNYDETWYFRRNEKSLLNETILDSTQIDLSPNGEAIYRVDTTYGRQLDTVITAFVPYRNFNASASMSTTIFGTKKFSKGKIRGIRHVIKPSASLNYQPLNRNRYIDYVDSDYRAAYNVPEEYEIIPSGVFGAPNLNNLGAFNVSYQLKNDLEGKYLSKKDSTVKNIKIFNNWNISGNYNLNADSLNFSKVSFTTGNTSFLKGIIGLGFNMSLDPYAINEKGQRINEFYFNSTKNPLRFDQLNLTVNTNFTIKQIRGMIAGIGGDEETGTKSEEDKEKEKLKQQETFLDLFNDFSISHSFRYTGVDMGAKDTFFISTNTISLRGNVKLTENWRIRVGNFGYDFKNKGFTYPDFGFERQLHCWKMNFNWQPRYGTYTFFIGVSSSTLNFIKANYNQNTGDARSRR